MFSSNATQVSSANYIEDTFACHLYTGNSTSGGTQTITNSIDLSTKGGMVWIKGRSAASNHILTDTTRGAGTSATNNNALASNLTSAEDLGGSSYDYLSSFSTTGFVVTQGGTTTATRGTNYNNVTYASWTFRKQPKFFDVVTYTGTGSPVTVNHNLGSTPGCIIIKATSNTGNWHVWHRSVVDGSGYGYLVLNTTDATAGGKIINSTSSTDFVVSSNMSDVGYTYVCYVFAHDAGGFGLTGTDNVITCGSFTTNGSGNATVTLDYEPQWVLVKGTGSGYGWSIFDNMRGMPVTGNSMELLASSSSAEGGIGASYFNPTATGFYMGGFSASQTYIYIAIRRGPMKVPTSGTSVFSPQTWTGNNTAGRNISTGFPVDLSLWQMRTSPGSINGNLWFDRLRGLSSTSSGTSYYLRSYNTDQESSIADYGYAATMDGFNLGDQAGNVNGSNQYNSNSTSPAPTSTSWNIRRAPSFFDEVCYTGTGVANTAFTHNLTVTPELMIVKPRSAATAPNWRVWSPINSTDFNLLQLSTNGAASSSLYSSSNVFPAIPTATTFTVGGSGSIQLNESGQTFVAYLFATCAGVSKVFSYTGNGSSQTINCGFTAGARWILIKRTDSTGDWYVWDSAMGIVSGNDPHLSLNTADAEVTTDDTIDTDSTGFVVNQVSATNVNVSSATYIGIAIA